MGTKFSAINIRLATPEDANLPVFDNTKLNALEICTRWGIITYQMHKTWPDTKKAQALEAGIALHQVFAAVRLWQLYYYDLKEDTSKFPQIQSLKYQIIRNQLNRLYKRRGDSFLHYFMEGDSSRTQLLSFCIDVLHSSNYEEDPDDKKRSMTALEEVVINYINRWDMHKYPIWVKDENDPNTLVGIEIKYELVIEFKVYDDIPDGDHDYHFESYRFTGQLDGIHWEDHSKQELFVADNKSSGRINEDNSEYDMNTQMRGYEVASSFFTGIRIRDSKVIINSLPVPKTSSHGGILWYPIHTEEHQIDDWYKWFYEQVQKELIYKDNPIHAPVSPHSCKRYYRVCSMMPFCTLAKQDQIEALDEMVHSEWNVLEDDN